MKSSYVSGAELARLTGVSRAAITQAKKEGRVYQDPKMKKFDVKHSVNLAYINNMLSKRPSRPVNDDNSNDISSLPPDKVPESLENLYRQKLEMEIKKLEEQHRKLQLENEQKIKNLLPFDLFNLSLGAFATGIRNNFLQIGNRIARGDTSLRDKIEREVTTSIKKTLENAEQTIRLYVSKFNLEESIKEGVRYGTEIKNDNSKNL